MKPHFSAHDAKTKIWIRTVIRSLQVIGNQT